MSALGRHVFYSFAILQRRRRDVIRTMCVCACSCTCVLLLLVIRFPIFRRVSARKLPHTASGIGIRLSCEAYDTVHGRQSGWIQLGVCGWIMKSDSTA